jgi:hypothetical protein
MGIERRQIRRKQVSVETILDEGKAYYFTVSGNLSEAGVSPHQDSLSLGHEHPHAPSKASPFT